MKLAIITVLCVVVFLWVAYWNLDAIDTTAPRIPPYYSEIVQTHTEIRCHQLRVNYWVNKINATIAETQLILETTRRIRELTLEMDKEEKSSQDTTGSGTPQER